MKISDKRRSPRRMERHPVYVLNITIPHEDVDAAYEPRKGILGYKVSPSVGQSVQLMRN